MSIKRGTKTIAGAPLEAVWGTISGDITDQADLQNALSQKVSADSPDLTGTPTAPTPSLGVSTNQIATTKFVNDSISSAGLLPSQTGQSGKFLTTDGTNASWSIIPAEIPSQSGQSGKFLTTNGSSVSWATVDALPSQSGQSGKFLTTNGSSASWSSVDALPSQTGNSGKYLSTNGTTASWVTPNINWYGTCDTGNAVQEKVVTCSGFTLSEGVTIRVKFTYGNSYMGQAQLNVNGTGAIVISNVSVSGTPSVSNSRYFWQSGEIVSFTYDGTYWIMDDGAAATESYYGITKLSNSVSSSSSVALTPYALYTFTNESVCHNYSSSSTYNVGDRVHYQYYLYECNTPISSAEVWDASHWTQIAPLQEQVDAKQDRLVSGTNIKTINNTSILGSGNLVVDGLPTQAGNSGKFLTTDGTNASWAEAGSSTITYWDDDE